MLNVLQTMDGVQHSVSVVNLPLSQTFREPIIIFLQIVGTFSSKKQFTRAVCFQAILDTEQHSISYTLSRNQAVIVEYMPDEEKDMFQVRYDLSLNPCCSVH
jgi:hypothetical protein